MALGVIAAAAGLGAIGTIAGTATQIKANKDALDAQKEIAKLELRQAKQRAKIEDRQTVKSVELADRQLVEGNLITDRQAVASIELADRQQTSRFNQIEEQASVAAAEDRAALASELQTSNLNAASRALEIRRSLMSVLGEQRATLAARGVGSGSLSGMFADDANAAATDDFAANRINRLQGEADAAAGTRAVNTSLANLRSSNLLTGTQSREGALASLANDREGQATQLRQIRERAGAELAMMRFSTKTDLKNQEEAAKLGLANARTQTRYANTAALISGFTQIASLGYSAGTQFQRIEPTRPQVAYQAPRALTQQPPPSSVGPPGYIVQTRPSVGRNSYDPLSSLRASRIY